MNTFYIAGIGMITPIGFNANMTHCSVKAGISGYALSDYDDNNGNPIKMSLIPDDVFSLVWESPALDYDEGDRSNLRHDHITILAIIAAQQAVEDRDVQSTIPMVIATPAAKSDIEGLPSIIGNLVRNSGGWLERSISRNIFGERASGIDTLRFAFDYLYATDHDYVLVGGSDSYLDDEIITPLIESNRLLASGSGDGFVLGEGAGFLLLTKHRELAMEKDGYVVALSEPGIADEPGSLGSNQPYLGEGLDQAFKLALVQQPEQSIANIYSSMNGEHFWAKEFGVAQLRNSDYFTPECKIHHPADCFGDLGTATAPVLIGLAAQDLFNSTKQLSTLVYCSSDSEMRGAVVLQKVPSIEKEREQ